MRQTNGKPITLAAVAAALLGLPTLAGAQSVEAICSGIEKVSPGDWAEYEMTTPQGSGTLRFAMLEQGASPGAGPWFEFSGTANGQSQVVQFQVDEWPFEPEAINAAVVKMGSQPAMELPAMVLAQMRSQESLPMGDLSESCRRSELLGEEAVEVPAGTFDAHRMKPSVEDAGEDTGAMIWVSDDIPFGIVKTEGADGSMRLTGSGNDATSTITETPQDAPLPGMGGP